MRNLKGQVKEDINKIDELERRLKLTSSDSKTQLKDNKERIEELKQENARFKKNLNDLAALHQKKKTANAHEIKELRAKCSEYKNKVRVANEKINSLGAKVAHMELEYRNNVQEEAY